MNHRPDDDLGGLSMSELFRSEAETQTTILVTGLLELEGGRGSAQQLEILMRAAHSLKGAARIVNLPLVVQLAHAMEDCFVAAQKGKLSLNQQQIDLLLQGVDLLIKLCRRTEVVATTDETAAQTAETSQVLGALTNLVAPGKAEAPGSRGAGVPVKLQRAESSLQGGAVAKRDVGVPAVPGEAADRVVRLTAENLNRLLGLAGESLIESRWLRPFAESLQRLKRQQIGVSQKLQNLRQSLDNEDVSERVAEQMNETLEEAAEGLRVLTARLEELDVYDRRSAHLSHRLYLEVLRSRMRPFSEGVRRFPRMVRDLGRTLGKKVRFEIHGETTRVDRDILERLETPLAHLLRNAVDHGCETPEQRSDTGKAQEASIRLEARHSAGMLVVSVADDGSGVDIDRLRRAVVEKGLVTEAVVGKLSESELLEFLFLPGFTLREEVTEISGRGVGLDIVQAMVKSVRGAIRLQTQPGRGLRVQLHLPLTLSVVRALLVQVAGEPYAVPLTQISRTLKLPRPHVETLEGRHYFLLGDQQVRLVSAHEVLECGEPVLADEELPVVVLGDRNARYGLIVDRFLGQRELVVHPLDFRLGKVEDISAAALMEDGSPVLIVDVDEMLRSIEKVSSSGRILTLRPGAIPNVKRQKRVLAVDDSLTVRELERKILSGRGYHTDVAVDGVDGWNAVRSGNYDLVLTDVDMPRMGGIELAALIKKDPKLKDVSVMIVSYKEREEDRVRGMEAGADYYLAKGNFHDETLVRAVEDLIGEPEP
jgi:two-component system sensor histidine kinase and response regulator WspE